MTAATDRTPEYEAAVARELALAEAWDAYRETDAYRFEKRWAGEHPKFADGSLANIFAAGFRAATDRRAG